MDEPDPTQQAVLDRQSGASVVLGGPGTGKTSVLVRWCARRVDAGTGVVALVPTRRGADRLRDAVASQVSVTSHQPVARTPQSLAWSVLREHALRTGAPAPRLVTGSELDDTLADVLAGHDDPTVRAPDWPEQLDRGLRGTRAFRDELREMSARLVEHGADADDLALLADLHRRPEWGAVAHVVRELQDVSGLRGDNAHDPAGIVAAAAALFADDDTGLATWLASSIGALAVDDAQDLTPAAWQLVAALAAVVPDVVVLGDPDSATQTFRGARSGLLMDAARWLQAGPREVAVLHLGTDHRQGPGLAAVTARVRQQLAERPARPSSPGVRTETDATPSGGDSARVVVCHDDADEAAFVAGVLRSRRHRSVDALRWQDMAVVVRSVRRADTLLRVLTSASVPVQVPGVTAPLRAEPVVAMLLDALDVAADPALLDPELLGRLARSPLGGADPLRWRRLSLAVRRSATERAGVAVSGHDALSELCDTVTDLVLDRTRLPGEGQSLAGLPAAVVGPVVRLARVLRAGAQVVAKADAPVLEHALWELWSASGLATRWRGAALGPGPEAARADRDLDAVIAVFAAASGWVDLHPTASVTDFTAHVRSRSLGDDRLGSDGPVDAVTLTTPAGAAGRQWDLVVVAGMQDGVWPDPRIRGSLLGLTDLVDVLRGVHVPVSGGLLAHTETRRAARREVVRDETRLFHVAVSRAREELLVTAVADGSSQPSDLCRLVAEPVLRGDLPPRQEVAAHGHTLPGLVALLRRVLLDHDPPDAEHRAAVEQLGRLAAAGVRGAAPEEWSWLPAPSTEAPRGVDAPSVSPSAVEGYLACPLKWYLTSVGGRAASGTAQLLGTLVHRALEEAPDADPERLSAVLDRSWAELELGTGWVSAHHRRRAEEMLAKLTRWVRAQQAAGIVPVAAEAEFRFTVGEVTVRGTIDRVERTATGGLRLVDLKTGQSAVSAAEAREHPQLMLYQLAAAHGALSGAAGVPPAAGQPGQSAQGAEGAVLLYVGGSTVTASVREQPALDAGSRAAAEETVRSVGAGMAGGRFPARPGEGCRFCPVRASCPAMPEGRRLLPVARQVEQAP